MDFLFFLGLINPKITIFLAPNLMVKVLFNTWCFYWIQFMIQEKVRSCLCKLQVGFRINSLVPSLLGASG